MKNYKCIAMLLAGGQGSRLYALTNQVAKPAVSFGGKYRIIDFTLSNCTNSAIEAVGVLTQYQPMRLNEYIGNGEPWDLDRNNGGVRVLPPYLAKEGGEWYKGTANAIFQNRNFIKCFDPEHVLILSGDHIYKMDYSKMLEYHCEKGADCTIAVIGVPIAEAPRFGIMSFDKTGRITDFEEKPKEPKSNNASMGIYIFRASALEKALVEDEADPASAKDFGKNVIPKMLAEGKKMYAYGFSGYWKDVGTVTSLWEANMDLLGDAPVFDVGGGGKVYSRNPALPPQYIGPGGTVKNSLITEGCEIYGEVSDSVLGSGVYVGKGAVVKHSVIMENAVVKEGAQVNFGIVDGGTTVGAGARVGDADGDKNKIALVGRDLTIADGEIVKSGEIRS
ncbi:glucose-1-phosphate adenylyltransferase [Clostridia bacterium]|nr:glucose-1-phosphate adenylyltransferase [Clostridia bacterium]